MDLDDLCCSVVVLVPGWLEVAWPLSPKFIKPVLPRLCDIEEFFDFFLFSELFRAVTPPEQSGWCSSHPLSGGYQIHTGGPFDLPTEQQQHFVLALICVFWLIEIMALPKSIVNISSLDLKEQK